MFNLRLVPHRYKNMEHKETGCRAPEGSILCINNCGFFGHATTMNMCSKCHKDQMLKEQQALLAASSIESIVNGSGTNNEKDPVLSSNADVAVVPVEPKSIAVQLSDAPVLGKGVEPEPKPKDGPSRCSSCHKRLGLTGFKCRCGNHFCGTHRYAEKHDCPFDYRMEGKDAIAKANPVVKAEKIDKI